MITRIYQLFLISSILLLTSCASSTPSINLLEVLGDYNGEVDAKLAANNLSPPQFGPKRTETRVSDIWVHPHEMPTGDYFQGGWIRVIVQESIWKK